MSTRSSDEGRDQGLQFSKEVHDHIRNLVDQAPPLTSVQRRRLGVLFARPASNSPKPDSWVDALPEADRRTFLLELVRACGEGQSPEQIDQLISAWQRTTEDREEGTP